MRRALAQHGGGCGPQWRGLRWFNARPCQMVQDERRFNFCHHPSCHIPALHRDPQSHGCFSPHSCCTKVQGRETASPRETQPITAVCGGRGSSTAATQLAPASPPPVFWHASLAVRFGEVWGKRKARGADQRWDPWLPLALPQHPLVVCGVQGCGMGHGAGRGPLPCTVPLVPAARAPLGCLCTAHPAAGLVRGQGLHHVQAVDLCPPAASEDRVRLLMGNCRKTASCPG